jgi:hypothetical protein
MRPGDESLSCEALQAELVTVAKEPALQSFVAKSGAAAQERLAAMNAATTRGATQSALALFGSLVPGGAWAGLAAAAAQAQAQQAQAAANLQIHVLPSTRVLNPPYASRFVSNGMSGIGPVIESPSC